MIQAIEFISQGKLRPDLMTKKLRLQIRGLTMGQPVMATGKLEDQNGQLAVTKDEGIGKVYLNQDLGAVMKKEKLLIYVFIGIAILLGAATIWAIVQGATAS